MMRDEHAGAHVRACDGTGAEQQDVPAGADRQINSYHSEEYRRAVSGLRWCPWCGDIGETELVLHNLRCFSLCTNCRCRFKLIRDANEQRDFGNELTMKTLDRLIATGHLVATE